MAKFIGRKEELQTLNSLLNKQTASLIVIKGRRRIGKSRLLDEFSNHVKTTFTFSGLPPTPNSSENETTPQSQRDEFAGQLARQIKNDVTNKNDWSDLFWCLAQHALHGRTLIILDEISWMGSKDSDFLGKLKNAWDLYFKKNDQLILAICGSASAWIDKNILSSTGFLGRESLNVTLDELPLHSCTEFWHDENERTSAHEKLKILSVTGGIPRYLEHINPSLSAENNIQQLCFNETGILFNEFEKIFSDLFYPKNALYKNIVSHLADGKCDQETICNKIGIKRGGDISEYLDDLIKSGFVSRDFTWNIKNATSSKLSHYRLKDNYSRFYLKYILPNRSNIALGNMKNASLSNLINWNTIMGLQVENLVLNNRQLIKDSLNIDINDVVSDNPFFQRKNTKQAGCQIDYLIQTKHDTLYICEIKYSKKEIGTSVIEEVNDKIKRLNIPKYFSYRTVLIHVNGVTEALEESKFFSNVINLGDFL